MHTVIQSHINVVISSYKHFEIHNRKLIPSIINNMLCVLPSARHRCPCNQAETTICNCTFGIYVVFEVSCHYITGSGTFCYGDLVIWTNYPAQSTKYNYNIPSRLHLANIILLCMHTCYTPEADICSIIHVLCIVSLFLLLPRILKILQDHCCTACMMHVPWLPRHMILYLNTKLEYLRISVSMVILNFFLEPISS